MEPTTTQQGTEKSDNAQALDAQALQAAAAPANGGCNLASPWAKRDPHGGDAPAPPPVWTRYIDSRLKQFCTR